MKDMLVGPLEHNTHHSMPDYQALTPKQLPEDLRKLEGAEDGELFASGMAAISTVLMGLLSQGDHIVASSDVYGGTWPDDRRAS